MTEERRNRAPKGRDEEWKDDTTGGTHHTRLSYRHHHVFPLSLRSAGCDMMTVRERRVRTGPTEGSSDNKSETRKVLNDMGVGLG